MFNYYLDTNRDAHSDTVKLFEEIKAVKYSAYTSTYVIDELGDAKEPKRSNMLGLIGEYNITVLNGDSTAERLAESYVSEGVIPSKYMYDALHIGIASANDLEYILTMNFKHINKLKTKTMTSNINIRKGYRPITIASPMEVIENYD
jgi:hypothetical protein